MIVDLNNIPTKPGVYLWKQRNKVLYVGKAKNLKNRISQYFQTGIGVWKEQMVSKATTIDWIITDNEEEALLLENQLIKKYKPPYNTLLKGDTGYTYLRIGEGDFPIIEFTRYKDKPGIYIGPKPWKKDLKDIFKTLRLLLKFRTCSDTKFKKGKVCSDYILGLCKGWCENKASDKEYQKIVNLIIQYFQGEDEPIKNLIKEKINKAINTQNFEYANVLKNTYLKLDKFINKQIIELPNKVSGYFVKIRQYNGWYFMVYIYLKNGKVIDIVKLKDTENNFIKNMINDGLISECKEISTNFYYCN